jgi:uncharacterized protein YacL
MATTATMKRPEYSAWLIRHAGWVMLISSLGFVLVPLLFLIVGKPDPSQFSIVSIVVLNAIIAPILYATFTIVLMRWYGAKEKTIKITAMIVFLAFMALGVNFALTDGYELARRAMLASLVTCHVT